MKASSITCVKFLLIYKKRVTGLDIILFFIYIKYNGISFTV